MYNESLTIQRNIQICIHIQYEIECLIVCLSVLCQCLPIFLIDVFFKCVWFVLQNVEQICMRVDFALV